VKLLHRLALSLPIYFAPSLSPHLVVAYDAAKDKNSLETANFRDQLASVIQLVSDVLMNKQMDMYAGMAIVRTRTHMRIFNGSISFNCWV
jgi:hypothetical protein